MSDFLIADNLDNMPLRSVVDTAVNNKLAKGCFEGTLADRIL